MLPESFPITPKHYSVKQKEMQKIALSVGCELEKIPGVKTCILRYTYTEDLIAFGTALAKYLKTPPRKQ